MRCKEPRTVGFQPDGKTIAWSQKNYSKEYPVFQLPCGKCISCRMEYARSWSVRASHEASIHSQNSFLTLTYNNESLKSPKLIYDDFRNFIRALRDDLRYKSTPAPEIGFMTVGEYGEINKRPHFHTCLFNYRPEDAKYKYSNDLGDQIYESEYLNKLWGKGITEFGDVTFKSAGYCARYSLKKLTHGYDQSHEFNPIFRTSRKYAIGKRWLEKYHEDVFNYGYIVLLQPDGTSVKTGIPRYYEKWLRENHLDKYIRYLTDIKYPKINSLEKKQKLDLITHMELNWDNPLTKTRAEIENSVLSEKINRLSKHKRL